jgi:hypothetical protein
MMDECVHEMERAWCSLCNGKEASLESELWTATQEMRDKGYFPAQFRGRCCDCGQWFPATTLILSTVNGYTAECCYAG